MAAPWRTPPLDSLPNHSSSTAEDMFAALVKKGNGGTTVRTMAAPAMSTQFVKSQQLSRASAGAEGSFSEVIYPTWTSIAERFEQKHENSNLFGYKSSLASDALPAGYGERSARALEREENTYQLKGVFPTAALAFAKLKARVEARQGDVEALDRIFASFWGISEEGASNLPKLHLSGSEPTRMAAMEDRAYHALSGHPGYNGGYRVDTATITPDALGDDIPLNWPRLRTGLKAIALVQIQGDMEISDMIARIQTVKEMRFRMDIAAGSQPAYRRPYQWERIIDQLILQSPVASASFVRLPRDRDIGYGISAQLSDAFAESLVNDPTLAITGTLVSIAGIVSESTNKALLKTIEVILEHDRERALIAEYLEETYDELADADLSTSFIVPRYKLVRQSLHRGTRLQDVGKDTLPDVSSHGKGKLQLDLREFREAKLAMPINVQGALNIAVYLTVLHPSTRTYAYMLMALTPGSIAPGSNPIAERLRSESYFAGDKVRALGSHLFSDFFMNTFEMLLRNVSATKYSEEVNVKRELWSYLSSRCNSRRPCPFSGGWRDLIIELRTCPEGWSLYYWVRICIGKRHKSISSSILAPIAAGEQVDFLSLVKRGVKERAASWASFYSAKYKVIEAKIAEQRASREKPKTAESDDTLGKYIPPHLRKIVDLEQEYDAEEILNRTAQYKAEEYMEMVEMQSKSKFFSQIEVFSLDRQITVGVSDATMREMLIEFYQARWYSLEKRIEKAKKENRVFRLGPHKFSEHPWGPLSTELPSTVGEMLDFMAGLDVRAWTILPQYLHDKFQKSISELWEDISNEINTLIEYIHEVHESLADDQEEIDACRQAHSVITAMAGVPPIPVPGFGYRAPFQMPERSIRYSSERDDTVVVHTAKAAGTTFLKPPEPDEEEALDDGDFLDDGFMDSDVLGLGEDSSYVAPLADSLDFTVKQSYLSYREIWHTLGLPDVSNDVMRAAIGIPSHIDVDTEHLDATMGPLIMKGEESRVNRAWAHKMEFIKSRLSRGPEAPLLDDM